MEEKGTEMSGIMLGFCWGVILGACMGGIGVFGFLLALATAADWLG